MLKEYLKDLIPGYVIEYDSHKDENQKGFIERYLEIFGEELDDYSLESIEDFDESLINIRTTPEAFLRYFEDLQGDIKNFGKTEAIRRRVIQYITYIYSIKGTKESLKLILAIRGYKVTSIVEHENVEYRYDAAGVNYDDPDVKYDEFCQGCSEITINMEKNYVDPVTANELVIIDQLIDLVLPIKTKIADITIGGVSLENLIKAIYLDSETPVTETEDAIAYDQVSYDDPDVKYDGMLEGTLDYQGDLYYIEQDPDDEISLAIDSNGDLVITGILNIERYSIDSEGDLIFDTSIA